jgi:4-hydroxybenzoate polyprenyltransferase
MYNGWLKGTWFSAVPYAAAFGALPVVATLALPEHPLPAWWAVTAAAMLGVAANLTNALPDLERDRQTGFRGLPSRIGARPSVASALALLLAAAATLGFGPTGPPGIAGWAGMAVTAALVVGFAPVAWRTARSRVPFYALMLVVPVFLAMIVANGQRLR